ncbi:hypothetical protein KAU93_04720, partial [Candidatus Bathyarchaeota archaeon]|nr:hypothetical protein [Candidatus Bathyarchaeota archaeon]
MRYEQDKRLTERGHKIYVISCKTFGAPLFEKMDNIEVYRIPAVVLPVIEYPIPNLLMLYFWIISLVRQKKIDM